MRTYLRMWFELLVARVVATLLLLLLTCSSDAVNGEGMRGRDGNWQSQGIFAFGLLDLTSKAVLGSENYFFPP